VCEKSIKNSQPFVRKTRNVRTPWGDFFDSHCISIARQPQLGNVGWFGVQVSHPHMIIQWTEIWRLKYQRGYF